MVATMNNVLLSTGFLFILVSVSARSTTNDLKLQNEIHHSNVEPRIMGNNGNSDNDSNGNIDSKQPDKQKISFVDESNANGYYGNDDSEEGADAMSTDQQTSVDTETSIDPETSLDLGDSRDPSSPGTSMDLGGSRDPSSPRTSSGPGTSRDPETLNARPSPTKECTRYTFGSEPENMMKKYIFYPDKILSWDDALKHCHSKCFGLATVFNRNDHLLFYKEMRNYTLTQVPLWLGGSCSSDYQCNWHDSGEDVSIFHKWAVLEPRTFDGQFKCMKKKAGELDESWTLGRCSDPQYFFCQTFESQFDQED